MNEFIAGAVSGFGQTLVGHPFDTVKVRLQNNVSLTKLKPQHYYRGVGYPLFSSSLINSIIFGTYYNTIEYTNSKLLSGFLSGLAGAPIVYLFDVYKTKRQMNYSINLKTFINSKGYYAALSRESLAFSSYFISYDYLKEKTNNTFLSGSIAGLLNWTTTYPLDVIRNRQMATNISFMEAYNKGNLWKGFNICAVRALIVNALGFYLYEECYKKLHS